MRSTEDAKEVKAKIQVKIYLQLNLRVRVDNELEIDSRQSVENQFCEPQMMEESHSCTPRASRVSF